MQVGGKTSAADRIVGAHFFSPAHIMPLLEIVRTDKTSKQVCAAVSWSMNWPCVSSGILAVHTQVWWHVSILQDHSHPGSATAVSFGAGISG